MRVHNPDGRIPKRWTYVPYQDKCRFKTYPEWVLMLGGTTIGISFVLLFPLWLMTIAFLIATFSTWRPSMKE